MPPDYTYFFLCSSPSDPLSARTYDFSLQLLCHPVKLILKKKISKCSHFSPKPATPRGVFPSCAAIPWLGIKQDPPPKLMRHGSSQVDTIPVLTAAAPAPREQDLPSHPALLPILQFPKVYSFANPSKNHRQGSCISHLQGR